MKKIDKFFTLAFENMGGFPVKNWPCILFCFINENICCGYSLEASQGDASSE